MDDTPSSRIYSGESMQLVELYTESKTGRLLRDWLELTVNYSQTHLTRDTDKLPALAGLAALKDSVESDTILAGLWKSCLHIGLLWQVTEAYLRSPAS